MSLAPQNQAPDITDALDGSLTSWYDNVNNCLKSSECVPGYYEYSQSPSYGTQCPVHEGASTKITVKCSRFEIIDLDNSYIDAEIEVPVLIPRQLLANEDYIADDLNTYYVGYKSSFDMVDQYRIYSNGDLIYTQNHTHYESFIDFISKTDSAKENSPCYITHNKVSNTNPNVPGVYIIVNNSNVDQINNITIPLKIPMNMFPVFKHLKYYPGFNGSIDIEIYPSYKNLVISNVDIASGNISHVQDITSFRINETNNGPASTYMEPDIKSALGFTQINTDGVNRAYLDTADDNEFKLNYQMFRAESSILTKCHLYLAKYMIKMDVYNALEANYLQYPLLFPIQTVSNVKFTHPMGTDTHFTLQNAATLSHCDTVFIVFPTSSNDRTVSYNPEIKAQLMINGKYYPREPLSTRGDDVRFTNLVSDALNINNNPLMTLGDDVSGSINEYATATFFDTANNTRLTVYQLRVCDHSNFVFAVPLSTDEDFMGGISSNGSTVQIELIGDRDSRNLDSVTHDWPEVPVAIFLEDKILKIHSMKPPGQPQIQLTNATLEQIVMSQGRA